MCCFSGPIEYVANTSIFARGVNCGQLLVYSMTCAARGELAMVLPLPVPPGAAEDCVRFVDLERYPELFDAMRRGFEPVLVMARSRSALGALLPAPRPKVHDVGSFEASFTLSQPQLQSRQPSALATAVIRSS